MTNEQGQALITLPELLALVESSAGELVAMRSYLAAPGAAVGQEELQATLEDADNELTAVHGALELYATEMRRMQPEWARKLTDAIQLLERQERELARRTRQLAECQQARLAERLAAGERRALELELRAVRDLLQLRTAALGRIQRARERERQACTCRQDR